jgi:hypothetical protein
MQTGMNNDFFKCGRANTAHKQLVEDMPTLAGTFPLLVTL